MKNKIEDFIFRIYRIIGRTLIKYSGNTRPASLPYITGDGFRKLAQHIYDQVNQSIQPEKVREGDIVFVGDSRIKKFLNEIHPQINAKYVLITHNGDEPIDAESLSLAKDKVIKWYGINVTVNDPKVVPIPLGIENKHYYVCGIPSVFRGVIQKNYPKKTRIFYGFTATTNPEERMPALEAMKQHPLSETVKVWRGFKPYLHLLAHYKFVASPPGSSVEGHRTWDAIYLGMVPIVKASITTNYFEKVGVPIWKVNDWKELDTMDEKALEKKFIDIHARGNKSVIFMDYWTDKVLNKKD